MADYQFNTDLGPKAQQGTSLGDLIKTAGAAQAYQQAQQLNPLALEKAQEELSQAKIGTKEKQLVFTDKQHQMIFDELGTLKTDQRWLNAAKDKRGAIEALMEREDRLRTKGIDPALLRSSAAPMYQLIDQKPEMVGQVVDNLIQRGGNANQFSQLNQGPTFVNTGKGIVPVHTSPFQGGGPGKTPTLGQYLAPTVATSETGAPMVIGGGNGGGVVQNAGGQGAGQAQSNTSNQQQPVTPVTPIGGAAQNLNASFGAKGGLQRGADETYDAYKARVADLSAKPKMANQALSLANPDSIPNQEYNNNQVLRLLESKNIRVGKLAEAIANKTGGIGLSSEEQEVQKYLEQRIRQNSLRSNQDENSQKMASGSFGTDINALRDIIYNDKGLLASQRLLSQGILKYQGNPNKPNLSAINEFENKFNLINQDRNVTHLLGVVGNKDLNDLSASDVKQLKKVFGGMSKEKMDSLFAKKQELEDLVKGTK